MKEDQELTSFQNQKSSSFFYSLPSAFNLQPKYLVKGSFGRRHQSANDLLDVLSGTGGPQRRSLEAGVTYLGIKEDATQGLDSFSTQFVYDLGCDVLRRHLV